MGKVAVSLIDVSKKFILRSRRESLAKSIASQGTKEEFWALKNVNLTIRQGEKIGIIGPNGAGKTTLLRIIAGITAPSSGKVQTYGKIVSLMHLEAGFHPELTGRENIYFNGMMAGMGKEEIEKNYDRIIEFADIGDFINAPFYTYSDGMKFRLAFSIAIASRCEILIMDEVFSSGDINFQQKTLSALKEFNDKSNVTTIVCSQIYAFVWLLSDVFYELDQGVIRKKPADEISRILERDTNDWSIKIKARQ